MKTVLLAFAALAALAGSALAQSGDCERLRAAINDAGANSRQYAAAAERQAAELERMEAYAHSIGCENRKFLFFGADPPAQCGQINAQIGRMRANLDDLRARGGGRNELMARYNAQCANLPRNQNLFDALFNNQRPDEANPDGTPANPDALPPEKPAEARSGAQAVCVRACDGSFFPVSYSASASRYGGLEDLCHALCPNADTQLFTYPSGGEIQQAISSTGQKYTDLPNALKYQKTFDSSCSCRRKGQSWAEALAGAEARLGNENKGDIIVTPEKAAELSRPKAAEAKPDPKAKSKPAKAAAASPAPGTDINGVDTVLSAQTQTISREGSGILGSDDSGAGAVGAGQGKTLTETGPDGASRRVRIVGPSL